MIDYVEIGKKIKQKRKEKKYTQSELGEKVNVSTVYISYIENGKEEISLNKLAEIASVLDTNIEYFITGTLIDSESYNYIKLNELAKLINDISEDNLKTLSDFIEIAKIFKKL